MLTFFKNLFGKSEPKAAAAAVPVSQGASAAMPTVEVAHLSLAAIVARFPEELKPLILREPEAAAHVAFPVPTIFKQLPNGAVKMSLASLQRQAQGVLKPLNPGDKRVVEVPLAEIFRHIGLHTLKRRPDQRPVFVPESGFNLFGDAANPYAIAPDDHLQTVTASQVLDLSQEVQQPTPSGAQRVLKMDDGLRQHFSTAAAAGAPPASSAGTGLKMEMPGTVPPPPSSQAKPAAGPALAPILPKPEGPTLAVQVAPLANNWPEDIKAHVDALPPEAMVTLPVKDVMAGLSRGRVIFTWGQIHSWLEPQPTEPTTAAAASTVLQLPLKIVAPIFLSASKQPENERKSMAVDESIPALFSDGRPPAPAPVPAAPAEPTAPAAEAAAASEPAPAASELAPTPAEPAPAPAAPTTPTPSKLPETIGEVFGQPQKTDWTPTEIVAGAVKLPGVSGAVVALQEGLPVAATLPEGVKSEVVAAFLPQIFARLNQYSNEMKLGAVDDLLFTTHGAHCQIYRLGYVYFAVLGKPGESLPWHELRIITEELARHTHS